MERLSHCLVVESSYSYTLSTTLYAGLSYIYSVAFAIFSDTHFWYHLVLGEKKLP